MHKGVKYTLLLVLALCLLAAFTPVPKALAAAGGAGQAEEFDGSGTAGVTVEGTIYPQASPTQSPAEPSAPLPSSGHQAQTGDDFFALLWLGCAAVSGLFILCVLWLFRRITPSVPGDAGDRQP